MDLPHSEKDEAELLGACLKSKNIQKTVIQEIPLDAIFIKENYYILKAIKELNAVGKFADLHTTWDYIEEKKYPVEYECLLAVSYHGDYIDLNYYIEHILSLSNKRKLADLSKTLAADVFTKDSANALIQKYTQKLAQLATGKAGSFESAYNILDKFTPTNTWEQEIRERVVKHRSGQTVFDGFRTGFPSLDNLIGGFGNGKSTIIGARSGSGKTTLVVNLMLLNKELYPNSKLGFFSLEMSARDIMEKTAAAYMQIAYQKIAEGNLSDDEVLKTDVTADFLRKSGFYFYDRPNLTVSNAYNVLRRAILEYDLQMVFIDYMTIMKPDRVTGNIYVDTDVISKAVQSMSREFNIPFVTLAQLSRKSADRSDGTPQLTDLRNSGSIEEDSDTVIMIHRPPLINGQASNRSQLHVVKNRHRGDLGRIELTYDHGRLYEAAPIEDELNRIFGGDDE